MTIPDWPVGWYPVSTSKKLKVGAVQVHQLGNDELVVARGESGQAFALNAHCPHMGAHLRHARVTADALVCPLHHWKLSATGGCSTDSVTHRPWPVREQLGMVFIGLSPDGRQLPPLPADNMLAQYYWTTGEPCNLRVDWKAAIVNGFDLTHLHTVHHRELCGEPVVEAGSTDLLLRYQTRVTGTSPQDRITKWLSGNLLHIEQRCLGTTIEVRSRLKQINTAAVVSMLPTSDGVRVFTAFGVRPGALALIRGQMARHLFTRFLKKDILILEDMRMEYSGATDVGVTAVTRFLEELQPAPAQSTPSATVPPVTLRQVNTVTRSAAVAGLND